MKYEVVVITLCGYLSFVNEYTERIKESGKIPDSKVISELLRRISVLKDELLKIKKDLGFTDGLAFIEDNSKFTGFEIKDCRFFGSTDNVDAICEKWILGYPQTANHYQFEVANLAYALAYPEYWESKLNPLINDIVYKNKKEERVS